MTKICVQCHERIKQTLRLQIGGLLGGNIEVSICLKAKCPNYGLLQIADNAEDKNTSEPEGWDPQF